MDNERNQNDSISTAEIVQSSIVFDSVDSKRLNGRFVFKKIYVRSLSWEFIDISFIKPVLLIKSLKFLLRVN